ncbi:MAG: valine--tRNA ligase [Oscillochloris sp.]|nr:valine--tRNA ligase [Oscillochloris sp.]
MSLAKTFDSAMAEPQLQAAWADARIFSFDPSDPRPIFAIDTPPPTVSGAIHIGHVYSYTQAEAMARFQRMRGHNVFYPFGFDDNGLPTERFVERRLGKRARAIGRAAFVEACLQTSAEIEAQFELFWKRLGFSVDWDLRYSTIDPQSRRIAQWSFIDLYQKGRIARVQAPNPWCIQCETAVAQAEMDDSERATTFYTLAFGIAGGQLPIATTRPELLPACVAILVHPQDARYSGMIGGSAQLPLSERQVPILADALVDPAKGSGAVMCCTFGDATDVQWWRTHQLPLIALVNRDGTLSEAGGPYAGLRLKDARTQILADLRAAGLLLGEQPAAQSVRVHERCGTPLEILETQQWFVRLLDLKDELLAAGRKIQWRPEHMRVRYEHWVQNLSWDWCISRQRYYGVPFPAWHCRACGATILADESQLPLDPFTAAPPRACDCGSHDLAPDEDVMDTWATSSLSPQIAARLFEDRELYRRLFPLQLRPQAHDIIRTWAFYTIARAYLHFGTIPWETIMISGHALDPAGQKLSKSKGNAATTPMALIEQYGADAVRYWACSANLGADQLISDERFRQGRRLVTKIWSAARLIAQHLEGDAPQLEAQPLLPSDRALLHDLQALITQATARWQAYDYAGGLELTERFFWNEFCDQYLELVKGRLYDGSAAERDAARATLTATFDALLRLFAPVLPHVTEAIWLELFSGRASIHLADWPQPAPELDDPAASRAGAAIQAITAAVRRYKTAHARSLGSPLAGLEIAASDGELQALLEAAGHDLRSVSRAAEIHWTAANGESSEVMPGLWMAIRDT